MSTRRTELVARRKATGWSQLALATEIDVRPYTVQRWESGKSTPEPRYRRALAKALEVSLGELDRLIAGRPASSDSVSDLKTLGLAYSRSAQETLDTIQQLGKSEIPNVGDADMNRRTLLKHAFFAVGAASIPSRDWLLATIDKVAGSRLKVDTDQIRAIRQVFGLFQELDVTCGGGHARRQLTAYFDGTVDPLLRRTDASTRDGRALYEVGAEQLYLIGWMAFDDGDHAWAQRYLIQSLRIAQEARSPELGAHVLAGLSDQSTLTGHPDHGLQLARTARAGLQQGHSPACLADLWALQARAEAALGDGRAVARSVLASQQAADQIRLEEEAEWARFIPGAYLLGEYAHAFRDLGMYDEAARFATLSADEAAKQQRARRGSLAHATLARAALAQHDLEAAAAEATKTLELTATVRSARSLEAVADLGRRLQSHRDSPYVASFLHLADVFVPA